MKMRRVRENKFAFGVFTGLEKFLKTKGINITVYAIRIIYLVLIIVSPEAVMYALILAYLLIAAILPYECQYEDEDGGKQ